MWNELIVIFLRTARKCLLNCFCKNKVIIINYSLILTTSLITLYIPWIWSNSYRLIGNFTSSPFVARILDILWRLKNFGEYKAPTRSRTNFFRSLFEIDSINKSFIGNAFCGKNYFKVKSVRIKGINSITALLVNPSSSSSSSSSS